MGNDRRAIAKRFRETYERLAPQFGYRTRKETSKPWDQMPEQNKRLMIAVCAEILAAPAPQPAPATTMPTELEALYRLHKNMELDGLKSQCAELWKLLEQLHFWLRRTIGDLRSAAQPATEPPKWDDMTTTAPFYIASTNQELACFLTARRTIPAVSMSRIANIIRLAVPNLKIDKRNRSMIAAK